MITLLKSQVVNYFNQLDRDVEVEEEFTRGELYQEVAALVHFFKAVGTANIAVLPGSRRYMLTVLLASSFLDGRLVILPETRVVSDILTTIIDTEVSILLVESDERFPFRKELVRNLSYMYHTFIGISMVYNVSNHEMLFDRVPMDIYNELLLLKASKRTYQPNALELLAEKDNTIRYILLTDGRFDPIPKYVSVTSYELINAMSDMENTLSYDVKGELTYIAFPLWKHPIEFMYLALNAEAKFVDTIEEAELIVLNHFSAQRFVKDNLYKKVFNGILALIVPRFIKSIKRLNYTKRRISRAERIIVLNAELPVVFQIALAKLNKNVYLTFGAIESLGPVFVKKLNKSNAKNDLDVGQIKANKITFVTDTGEFAYVGPSVGEGYLQGGEVGNRILYSDDSFDNDYFDKDAIWLYGGKTDSKEFVNRYAVESFFKNLLVVRDCKVVRVNDERLPDISYALVVDIDERYADEHDIDMFGIEDYIKQLMYRFNRQNMPQLAVTDFVIMPYPQKSHSGFLAHWAYPDIKELHD